MNSIEEILAELYAIDPSFKRHEGDLRSLVRRLRLAKPDFSIDDAFVRRLRSDITHSGKPKPVSFLIRSYFIQAGTHLVQSSAFGMAVALVLLVPLAYTAQLYNQKPLSYQVENASVSLGQQQEIVYKPGHALSAAILPVSFGISAASSSSTAATSTSVVNATSTPSFVFTGTAPALTQATGSVLEADTSTTTRTELLSYIQKLGFELTGLTSSITATNSTIGNVQIQETKPFGYIVDMDLATMTLAIAKNPAVWPDESSIPAVTTTASDTINIALSFLKDHNIDTSNYAEAVLLSPSATSSTATSSATVLLPLIINNKNVYAADGSLYGIIVTIDQIVGKVTEVANISLQKYTASSYGLEADFNNILTALNATTSPDAATTTPALNTPVSGLIHYSTVDGEFFVPGLIFPVASSTGAITASLLQNSLTQ